MPWEGHMCSCLVQGPSVATKLHPVARPHLGTGATLASSAAALASGGIPFSDAASTSPCLAPSVSQRAPDMTHFQGAGMGVGAAALLAPHTHSGHPFPWGPSGPNTNCPLQRWGHPSPFSACSGADFRGGGCLEGCWGGGCQGSGSGGWWDAPGMCREGEKRRAGSFAG